MTIRFHLPRPSALFSIVSLALPLAALCFAPEAEAKNQADDCVYFAQFLQMIQKSHDSGKTRQETMDMARQKAKADHLDHATGDLFVGEAIGAYYDKPEYVGTASQVYKQAYGNCMAGKLP